MKLLHKVALSLSVLRVMIVRIIRSISLAMFRFIYWLILSQVFQARSLKSWKSRINLVASVRRSVCISSAATGRCFILGAFTKTADEMLALLMWDKNIAYFTWRIEVFYCCRRKNGSAALKRTNCCVSMATLLILYIVDSAIRSARVEREIIVGFVGNTSHFVHCWQCHT